MIMKNNVIPERHRRLRRWSRKAAARNSGRLEIDRVLTKTRSNTFIPNQDRRQNYSSGSCSFHCASTTRDLQVLAIAFSLACLCVPKGEPTRSFVGTGSLANVAFVSPKH